ncbi:MAG TPA: ferredoxin--NADP reductase [Polyangiaceae bacterium]|nr:ferredoxin--NADP reductase [Polyangiaceae bacterium]
MRRRRLSPLARGLEQLRRDVVTAAGALVGRNPPPLVRVAATPSSPVAHTPDVRPMRVAHLVRETPDAVTVVLVHPGGEPVAFAAGQFFTLHVRLPDGDIARRAYSASSSPLDPARVAVTVKRVAGGRVSTHFVERLREGDVIDVHGPSGSFTPAPARGPRRIVLVGGGSGITPLASIARTLLATEPDTRVVLVYGNRAREDVIFHDALHALAGEHPNAGRFVVRHVLESPPAGWSGGVGRLDGAALERELAGLGIADALPTEYYLCGPDPLMQAARTFLAGRGVAHASIHEERFVSAHASPAAAPSAAHAVVVRSRAGVGRLVVPPGRTLLEAAFDARVDLPFSCTVGGCGACRVRLVDGDVAMDEPNCLTPEERAAGYVLACMSRPGSACTVEVA